MPPKEIDGSDIKLRLLEQKDMEALLRLATEEDVAMYVPWAKYAQDSESAEQQIDNFQHQFEQGTHVRYGIFQGDKMAGYIGVWPSNESGTYETGLAVLPEFRGQGIAGQAVSLLEKEIGSIGGAKIIAHVDESNSSSSRMVEKQGFVSTDKFNDQQERRFEKQL